MTDKPNGTGLNGLARVITGPPDGRGTLGGMSMQTNGVDSSAKGPQRHRTVDRVTRILEEVVYNPGISFTELAHVLDAPKSSVHGFIRGLLANGWLHEIDRGFFVGPAVYGLATASGNVWAGMVSQARLLALSDDAGLATFLGVQAGDHLIYIAAAGTDPVADYDARSNIRRGLLTTAGGNALLAAMSEAERISYLHRHQAEHPELIQQFLVQLDEIRRTGIVTNVWGSGSRFAIATAVFNQSGEAVAEVTLVGPKDTVQPRVEELSRILLRHVKSWT
ncbi:IclR family transcriptional regulator [Mycobacterium sp. DL440]|uniref:IclR family transcriptional regulator n=1 Tax=Mycobacterium sp. DL440 TaxID=2675523 RepID=UPI001FB87040|nr:IclR family transcriptional regulator C-terminal domain-containing protein [Mycobacterium sp. DL440]